MKLRIKTLRVLGVVAIVSLIGVGNAFAGEITADGQAAIDAFDIDRAFLADEQMFVPFQIKETMPLADAATAGIFVSAELDALAN